MNEKLQAKYENEAYVEGLLEGLKRHTWMKDGTTYVGNGTYTLKEAVGLLKRDIPNFAEIIETKSTLTP